jgi:hypothetical protein
MWEYILLRSHSHVPYVVSHLDKKETCQTIWKHTLETAIEQCSIWTVKSWNILIFKKKNKIILCCKIQKYNIVMSSPCRCGRHHGHFYQRRGDIYGCTTSTVYDSFHQKCSKLGIVNTLGLKIRDGNENLKTAILMPFQGPSKYTFFTKFQKFHSLN